MDRSNRSDVMAIIRQFLANNNLSITAEDVYHEQFLDLLQLTGAIPEQGLEISEKDLMEYQDYKIHKALVMYIPPVLLFFGFLGNLLTLVFLRYKTITRPSTNTLLAALSVADFLVLAIGLFRKWLGWIIRIDLQTKSNWTCKLLAVIGYSTSQYSVWLIVAITIERYIAVQYPFKVSKIVTLTRTRKLVCLLALLFIVINVHFFWTIDIHEEHYINSVEYRCEAIASQYVIVMLVWPWVDAVLYSVAPTLIIGIFNIMIICGVAKSRVIRDILQRRPLRTPREGNQRCSSDNNIKLTVLLLTIPCTFLLTTLPMTVVVLVNLISPENHLHDHALLARSLLIRTIAELLMYLNHSINFFLYCATTNKFRNILFHIICGRKRANVSRHRSFHCLSWSQNSNAHKTKKGTTV